MKTNLLEGYLNFLARSLGIVLLVQFLLGSCIEPFEFNSDNEKTAVIIEGHISDLSSDEYLDLFGEQRYFHVKVKYSGVVKNLYDEYISGAEVELISDQNVHWDYTEDLGNPGTYYLYYTDVAAQPNVAYQVNVKLPNGEEYASKFEQMPVETNTGEISEAEVSRQRLVYRQDEQVIRSFVGLDVNVKLPSSDTSEPGYYKWDCLAVWKLKAELGSIVNPGAECWISEIYYLDEFTIATQKGLPVNQNLFFLQTSGNQKTKFGFAARVRQQKMTRAHYQFWEDLKAQEEQAELFSPPPYNLYSNIEPVGHDKPAYGYFGVVNEENYTWFFDKSKLSYVPTYINECIVQFPREPAEWCFYCLNYGADLVGTNNTDIKPKWWTWD